MRNKKAVKKVIIAIVICLLYILLRIGIERASIETVDISRSPDGQYTLLLQSRGNPFSENAKGRLVLYEGRNRIIDYDFSPVSYTHLQSFNMAVGRIFVKFL